MGFNRVWLASRNATRNAQRAAAREAHEAAGRRPRRIYDGMGRQRSRENFSKKRSRERMLARLRKMRRPFVQGRRRLWGKGPAPLCYATAGLKKWRLWGKGPALRCSAPQLPGEREERRMAPCSSPCSMAVCCSLAPSVTPAGDCSPSSRFSPWEPLDTPILDLLTKDLDGREDEARQFHAKWEFRALAQHAGISLRE